MKEDRPFYRVFQVTKQEAASQQIEAAIAAFHAGQFAAAITLAAAAEDMAPARPGGVWERIRDDPARKELDTKKWIARLNETRNWPKHDRPDPTRNLVAVEVGFFILRAMDRWEPWSQAMMEFKLLWFSAPKLFSPEDYDRS